MTVTARLPRLSLPRWLTAPRAAPWISALAAASAALLLAPKLLLIEFSAGRLWLGWSLAELPWLLAQDLLLALATFAITAALLAGRRSLGRLCGAALLCTLVLLLLLLDCRVRQLWLRPTDPSLIAYGWENRTDLASGIGLFFCHAAGFDVTFRRWLVYLLGAQLGLWTVGGLVLHRSALPATPRRRGWVGPCLVAGAALGLMALGAPRYRYQLEECLLVEPWLGRLRPAPETPQGELARACDQPAVPLAQALAPPRRIAAERGPYRNLVVYMLESVRWRGLDLTGSGPTPMPTLRRLAREGLVARTWVSMPHSSKATWTILTGRHPYPGIEMREATRARVPSFVHALRARGACTWVFSSAHLAFENMSGLLRAAGIERHLETAQLGAEPAAARLCSFGGDDGLLTCAPASIARGGTPFAAMFIPVAAHYPYPYPGKPETAGDDLASYQLSLAYADQVLARVLAQLAAQGLLHDTLVVLVGDHGESFGEHGSFAHNNSLFEEEVTVPLVLWSADGALRHPELLTARHVDVAPTVADLMGLADAELPVQGRSLLRPDGQPRPAYLTSFFDDVAWGVVEGGEKLLYMPSSAQVYRYDLARDPGEADPRPVTGARRDAVIRRLRAFAAYQRAAFPPPGAE